jgi:membrane protein implicated in regulation of membrane protease activity
MILPDQYVMMAFGVGAVAILSALISLILLWRPGLIVSLIVAVLALALVATRQPARSYSLCLERWGY